MRHALKWLDNWPVGLKLNTELSHFFYLSFIALNDAWAGTSYPGALSSLLNVNHIILHRDVIRVESPLPDDGFYYWFDRSDGDDYDTIRYIRHPQPLDSRRLYLVSGCNCDLQHSIINGCLAFQSLSRFVPLLRVSIQSSHTHHFQGKDATSCVIAQTLGITILTNFFLEQYSLLLWRSYSPPSWFTICYSPW